MAKYRKVERGEWGSLSPKKILFFGSTREADQPGARLAKVEIVSLDLRIGSAVVKFLTGYSGDLRQRSRGVSDTVRLFNLWHCLELRPITREEFQALKKGSNVWYYDPKDNPPPCEVVCRLDDGVLVRFLNPEDTRRKDLTEWTGMDSELLVLA